MNWKILMLLVVSVAACSIEKVPTLECPELRKALDDLPEKTIVDKGDNTRGAMRRQIDSYHSNYRPYTFGKSVKQYYTERYEEWIKDTSCSCDDVRRKVLSQLLKTDVKYLRTRDTIWNPKTPAKYWKKNE